jgi:GNAT superfamily N-acetyltransferase
MGQSGLRLTMVKDVFEVTVEDIPDPAHISRLVQGLTAHNETRAEPQNRQPVGVFLRHAGEIVGGADGYTHWHWLFVSHLWVDEALRHHGAGRHVMNAIEGVGRKRGCGAAWLDTFSFQALAFYRAIGYRPFGELHDFPPGHTRHYLWKPLDEESLRHA